jgi:ABC-2 type transport system permease protein
MPHPSVGHFLYFPFIFDNSTNSAMNKIFLVIKREYLTRVRKKSFIIMTIAAPLLITAFYGIIIYFAVNKDLGDTEKQIYVSDQSGVFTEKLTSKEHIVFTYGPKPDQTNLKKFLEEHDLYGVLNIPDSSFANIQLVAVDQPSLNTVNHIENQLASIIKQQKMEQLGINQTVVKEINATSLSIQTAKATDKGSQNSSATASTAVGYVGALLIYFFIFLYGVQVMRGVIEEKTNRIVEVIISSLKPFELMMGKIIGIAMVGLTQFIIWVVLITVLGGGSTGMIAARMKVPDQANDVMSQAGQATSFGGSEDILTAILGFNYPYIISVFIFFFITGYLFYGALFAAIGSAVDSETDTQQFMLPVTMPLVLALVLAQSAVMTNPNGALAFWLSMVPLTSPIVMMMRLPFGVPGWELALSMFLMVCGFVFTVWIASRIYRIGILMYGKKPSYKEIGKWLFSKG